MKNQQEWYDAAIEASKELFSAGEEIFKGLGDQAFYAIEVTRFDTFVKLNVTALPRATEEGRSMDKRIRDVCYDIMLKGNTNEEDFLKFIENAIVKMTDFRDDVVAFHAKYKEEEAA